MREIDFNLKENPFINFQSSRYSMTARINVEKMWKYSKENNCSFFVLSLGCLMKAVNSIPQLKRRIVNDKVIEHDYLDGVCPIMDENNEIYKEMRVKPPEIFNDFESGMIMLKKHPKMYYPEKQKNSMLKWKKEIMKI